MPGRLLSRGSTIAVMVCAGSHSKAALSFAFSENSSAVGLI
jgi:hypothetical protein